MIESLDMDELPFLSSLYPVVCGTDMMDSLDYLPLRATYRRDEIIREYFHLGFDYNDIVAFLYVYHDVNLGVRQLKRILQRYNLRRRKGKHSPEDSCRYWPELRISFNA